MVNFTNLFIQLFLAVMLDKAKILANSSPIDSNRYYNSTLIQDSGNCVGLQKRCKNGDCIRFENFCDGVQHCLDGSDEIPESCIHLNCPKFAFRCAYGACIRRDLTCNNKRDCADNSDEAAAVCGHGNVSNYIGNCLNNQFQCGSGECIPIENACDGRQDCSDTSDETVDLCAGRYCPSFAFRCGYGACVSGIAKCNSIIDCLDGSDEVSVLCNNEKFHTETITDNDLSTNVIDSSQFQGTTEPFINLTISANQSRDCMIDNRPNLIVIHQATNTTIPIEEPIKEYQPITYRCEENYILDNEVINHCVQGNWMLKHPNCLRRRYCSTELISGKTFQARCMYKGSRVSCTNNIQPGTIAFIECKNGYKKFKDFRQEFISCNEYGQWNYNFDFCQAECGISKDDNNVAPWNVGIYTKLFSRRRKQICSGTIITENIILSTANCFWNSEGQHLYDPKKFTVVVGKYHQRNNADELLQIQNFNVSEIYIPSQENSSSIAYQNNIAVLVLNGFIDFNSNIKPVCIDWLNSNESLMSSNRIGKIPVWNKTNSNNNEKINLIEVETISSTDCIVLINARFGLTTTNNNQYCVIPINNDRICNKDNGGGLLIPYKMNNIEKYHLLGLINFDIKLNARNECRTNEFLTVTNIQYYADIITNYQLKFRLK